MSKRGYQDWLDSLPEDSEEYPHQDDPTEEELRALAEEWPDTPPPTDEDLEAMARHYAADESQPSDPTTTPENCQ